MGDLLLLAQPDGEGLESVEILRLVDAAGLAGLQGELDQVDAG